MIIPFEHVALLFELPMIASLGFSLQESTWPGKLIVVLLFASSIYVWSIMIIKFQELKRAAISSNMFDRRYRQERNPVALFLRKERYPESPLFEVYEKACVTMGAEVDSQEPDASELFAGSLGDEEIQLKPLQLEAVRNSAERTVSTTLLNLERTMPVLATAVTACPFLGLLGTVWGVMDAFSGMAEAGSATLSAVAPGIAGALLTTVVGLLVALPSAIGYNMLTSRVRELQVRTDNFSQEIVADIQRNFLRD
jgi:biopolymer transport protein ExbB/TolQ